jgi:N-acetylmuramoyl-L-alanine amidase
MKAFLCLCCIVLLTACSSAPTIDRSIVSANQDSRVQFVVLHYTSTDLAHSLALLSQGEVSSHYLIAEQPATIYQLVDENRRAWHAGASQWRGRTWLNASTIGIELVNQGFTDTPEGRVWQPYSEAQIAPQRKVDPGPLFPWRRLGEAGLIPWPDAAVVAQATTRFSRELPSASWFVAQLRQQGYAVPATEKWDKPLHNVLAALQMKYRPARFDGQPDAETAALLQVLNNAAEH